MASQQTYATVPAVAPGLAGPTGGWAQLTVVLLQACAVAAAVDLGAAWYRVSQSGGDLLRGHLARADRASKVAALAGTVLVVVTAVAFVVWVHRVVSERNRRAGSTFLSPVAAAVLCVLPVANLIWPPALMHRLLPDDQPRRTPLVAAWWALWIIGIVVALFALHHPDTLGGFRSGDEHRMLADACRFAAAVLATQIVRGVDHRT